MIRVGVARTGNEDEGWLEAQEQGVKVLLQTRARVGVTGREGARVGNDARAVVLGVQRHRVVLIEQGQDAPVGVAQEDLTLGRNAQPRRCRACFLHALLRQIAQLVRIDEQALLDHQ